MSDTSIGATGATSAAGGKRRTFSERMLDGIEKLGNKVPHPVLMFLYLILGVIVLSQILAFAGVSVTEQIAEPVPYAVSHNYYADTTEVQSQVPAEGNQYSDVHFELKRQTIPVNGLLTIAGIRFIFTSFVANFQNFGVVAVTFIAMLGAGVAEGAGMMDALIRKLVASAPSGLITFLIVLVGGLSSLASDAGYLILIPLGAVAFVSLRRHPLAGLAAGFAGVGGAFGVNLIIQPIDAMLTEVANEVLGSSGRHPISVVNNFYFSAVSLLVLCLVATVVTERMIEPRLGAYTAAAMAPAATEAGPGNVTEAEPTVDSNAPQGNEASGAQARGLRFALFGFLGVLIVVLAATMPPGAPLRDPETGNIIGNTPFMDSLLFIITLFFLVSGICYGIGARTITSANDVIAAATKTFNSLGGLVLMLLMVAQFIAYFNYSNLPQVVAIAMAILLEQAAIPAILLLVAFILVIFLLTFIIPGIIPKWAIFAPVFIPIFLHLGIGPQTVLAAYRIGDSPVNMLTPLMVYLPFIVTVAQRYQKNSGIGTIVSLMLPYAVIMLVAWVLLFVLWFALGIPLGPGYPVRG
jgi:aminobenzoyl-glutamate transport protein